MLKEKKTRRKKNKLLAIRQAENFKEGKKFEITIPIPYSFGMGTK